MCSVSDADVMCNVSDLALCSVSDLDVNASRKTLERIDTLGRKVIEARLSAKMNRRCPSTMKQS